MKKELEIQRAEIFRGRQHKLVFLELQENGKLVSEITKELNSKIKEGKILRLREVSRALKWLVGQGYSECLNPSNKQGVKGISYRLSKTGKELKNAL